MTALCLTLAGLVCDFIGAICIFTGVKKAMKPAEKAARMNEEKPFHDHGKDAGKELRILASSIEITWATVGLGLLLLGFVLQGVGAVFGYIV